VGFNSFNRLEPTYFIESSMFVAVTLTDPSRTNRAGRLRGLVSGCWGDAFQKRSVIGGT